jgi:hypothetical protein
MTALKIARQAANHARADDVAMQQSRLSRSRDEAKSCAGIFFKRGRRPIPRLSVGAGDPERAGNGVLQAIS